MNWFLALYTHRRLYTALTVIIAVFVLGFPFPVFFVVGKLMFLMLLLLFIADFAMLFGVRKGMEGYRILADRFSNGDDNSVKIQLFNYYRFAIKLEVIDEIPIQFQVRDFSLKLLLAPSKSIIHTYQLRPVKRGNYVFGALNVYATGPIGIVSRRFKFNQAQEVPVYPSFLQMRRYELMAISNRLTEVGVKKIRRLGHNMEFDQIRTYVKGDDYRAINWKATARSQGLMVNQYQDERSQQIYCLIDKGRAMKMPFEGMTLLDYAINASLVLSNIAVQKQDKAGLVTFNKKIRNFLPASNRPMQIKTIMEALYQEKTAFQESDFERMYVSLSYRIKQRSLIMLFTNFETLSGFERQLKYLRGLAKKHLLIIVFFENTELRELRNQDSQDIEQIYIQTIAEKLAYEKRQITKELQRYGIFSIFTPPQELTVNTINKYLEMKARGLI